MDNHYAIILVKKTRKKKRKKKNARGCVHSTHDNMKLSKFKKFIGVRVVVCIAGVIIAYVLVDLWHLPGWLSFILLMGGSMTAAILEYLIYDKKVFIQKEA